MLRFDLIVVPTDFSDRSLRALDYAVGLADSFNARLEVVYVHETLPPISDVAWQGDFGDADRDAITRAEASLNELIKERVPGHVDVKGAVVSGQTAKEIIKYAERDNADLIVMSTHGRTGLKHALMGSVTEQVVREAPCPVMALKRPMVVKA